VLVLDLPGEVAFARKGEFTPEGLEAVRQGYLALVPRLGAEVVDASAPPEQVRDDVVARIRTHHRLLRGRPAAPPAARSGPAPAPPATPR
jgi:thymidylate kinase